VKHSDIARTITLTLLALLALTVLTWQYAALRSGSLLPLLWLIPLLFPLPGLIRGRRFTYAWATLITTGYVALALTEVVAQPAHRLLPSLILFASFALFIALVAFLRTTRNP